MSTGPMSTRTTPHRPSSTAPKLTWAGEVRSEWLRLVTIRSAWVTLVVAGALMALLGVLATAVATGTVDDPAGGGPRPGFSTDDPISTLTAGSTMVILVIGVLGVILGARDHGTGMVRTTYAAVPRRWPVLVARLLVLATLAAAVIAAGTAIAYVAGGAVLDANGSPPPGLGDDGVLRALLGTVGYLVGVSLIGVALGTLTRSVGSGIGVLVALFLVVPGLGSVLLPDGAQDLLDYLPSQAAASFMAVDPAGGLSVTAGTVVFIAWVVGAIAAAWFRLVRRDV